MAAFAVEDDEVCEAVAEIEQMALVDDDECEAKVAADSGGAEESGSSTLTPIIVEYCGSKI